VLDLNNFKSYQPKNMVV